MTHPSHPPSEPEVFFTWLKATSEHFWRQVSIDPHISGFQIQAETRWLPGLTEREIAHFEADLGLMFPSIYRLFLKHMNGTDKMAINVYGESGEPYGFAPTYYSYPRDLAIIRDYIDWIYEEYKVTAELVDQLHIPHIVPIRGHRFLVVDRCETHPVLSMYGQDTIIYSPSLQVFLVDDILHSHKFAGSDVPINVRFWLDNENDNSYLTSL